MFKPIKFLYALLVITIIAASLTQLLLREARKNEMVVDVISTSNSPTLSKLQTYTNTQYGFEITYPNYLLVQESNESYYENSGQTIIYLQKYNNNTGRLPHIDVGFFKNTKKLPLDIWIKENSTTDSFSNEITKVADKIFYDFDWKKFTPVKIGTIDGYRFMNSGTTSDFQDYVLFSQDDKVFFVSSVIVSNGDLESDFSKIFPTFKFINKNSTKTLAGKWRYEYYLPPMTDTQIEDTRFIDTSPITSFDLDLKLDSYNRISGTIVSITGSGNKLDSCDNEDGGPDCIIGIIKNNVANVDFKSSFTDSVGKATITYNPADDTITWKITKKPEGEYHVSDKAVLKRVK